MKSERWEYAFTQHITQHRESYGNLNKVWDCCIENSKHNEYEIANDIEAVRMKDEAPRHKSMIFLERKWNFLLVLLNYSVNFNDGDELIEV